MKITAYYYLDYPDVCPVDPGYAATTMYVEVGEDDDSIDHFVGTYAFQVYTFRYVQQEFFAKGIPLAERSVLIVPDLKESWMSEFLDTNIGRLGEWGERRGL